LRTAIIFLEGVRDTGASDTLRRGMLALEVTERPIRVFAFFLLITIERVVNLAPDDQQGA
jgi:hypothetical protein